MRTATPRVVPYRGSETSRFVVEGLRVAGKRVRKFFKTRRAADKWLRKTKARISKEGEGAVHMPEQLRVEATKCAALLKPYGRTITDATTHFLAHLAAMERTCAVAEMVTQLLAAKTQDGASDDYLADLKQRLNRFSEDFGTRKAAEITSQELDDWLRGLGGAPQSRNNFRTVLSALFAYGVGRNYCRDNPVMKTAKAKVVRGEPGIFTPDQMRKLLEKAPARFLPFVAIGAFAGLRTAEIERLDWSAVDLPGRLIEVSAKNAKTAQRRLVVISDNLAVWLAPLAKKSGPVADIGALRIDRAATLKDAEVKDWPDNALRHSFASYHLAHHKNAAALAAELGHTNSKVLYAHYRNRVRPDVAAQWWQIMPPAEYGNVVAFGAEVANG